MNTSDQPPGSGNEDFSASPEPDQSLYDIDWEALDKALQEPIQRPRATIVHQENVRWYLAAAFTAVFAVTIIASLVSAIGGWHWTETKELLQLLLPAETALLGAVIGFYFGKTS